MPFLGERFEINCTSSFLKVLKIIISKVSKITKMIYPKDSGNQTCDYWLITPNQQTLCIETIIF